MRIGTGWDIHPLVEGRPLIIGGVTIDHPLGKAGHSDGDALIHAIIDALFGALAMGDIGTHFPPSDNRWKDAASTDLLCMALDMFPEWEIVNIDSTVILQKPKLKAHIGAIRESLASTCQIPLDHISVKAKTAEGLLGEVGEGYAIIAQAVVMLRPRATDLEEPLDLWV
ncbi:MAG TPA: 2-C-methyl-D-erythritol 2,4-cyclodiphosphate synthase [Sphaerochaetaceae bacterium]|nr:2-C-methyl-D-erythritol 2,4-cyclodiphosphate synthase [Sphaerochaetaceae bacterium]